MTVKRLLMHRLLVVVLLVVVLLVGMTMMTVGCASREAGPAEGTGSAGAAADNKRVTLLHSFPSNTLDPHNDWVALRAGIVETLVKLDENLNLKPHLATEWEQKDPHTWVFTIRDGVMFHDGTKLDAQAVKASLERALRISPKVAKALKIAEMHAEGQRLTIRTSEPNPVLPSELVNPNAAVVSVAAEEKMGTEAFSRAPIGTGPFKVKAFESGVKIQLERFDQYWGGPAKIREALFTFNTDASVRAMAFQSKEADIVYHLPPEMVDTLKNDPDLNVVSIPSLRSHFLTYNLQKPELRDIRMRQALDALIDREAIAREIMHGHAMPAGGPFNPRFSFAGDAPVSSYDPERAKRLLAEAGWTPGPDGKLAKNGKPLALELITYPSRPELPMIAQVLQAEAAKIGLTVTIRTVDDVDAYLSEHADWDLATYSNLTAPRGDGGYFLNVAYLPDGALNPGKVAIPELIALIETLNRTSDKAQRDELTRQAVAIIRRELLHSYIVYPNILVGVNKRVVNWTPGAEEYYLLTNELDVK